MKKYSAWSRLLSMLLVLTLCFSLAAAGAVRVRAEETDEDEEIEEYIDEDEEENSEPDPTEEVEEEDEPFVTDPDDEEEEDDDDDVVEADPVQEHSFKFALNDAGDTLTATCSEDDCPLDKSRVIVRLVAEDRVYDGKNVTATADGRDKFKTETEAEFSSISYTTTYGAVGNTSDCGAYTAKMTVTVGGKDYVLQKKFNVTRRQVTLSGLKIADKPYDGTTKAEVDVKLLKIENMVAGDNLSIDTAEAKFPSPDKGVYTVTLENVRLKGADADNYQLQSASSVKCEFVSITARDITNAEVTLGPMMFANGREQKQAIESVIIKDEEAKINLPVTYSAMNDSFKEPGEYTMTINGTGNFTGSIKVPFVVLPSVENLEGNNIKLGKGSAALILEDNALGLKLESDLKDVLRTMSADELAEIVSGKQITWTLRVYAASPDSLQKAAFSRAAGANFTVLSDYFSLSLTRTEDGSEKTITKAPFRLVLTMDAPEKLGKKVKTVRMICGGDDGTAEALDARLSSDRKYISFAAGNFATFAVAEEGKSSGSSGKFLFPAIVVLILALIGVGVMIYLQYVRRNDEQYDTEGVDETESEMPGFGVLSDLVDSLKQKFTKKNSKPTFAEKKVAKAAPKPVQPVQPVAPAAPAPEKKPTIPVENADPEDPLDLEGILKMLDESENDGSDRADLIDR